ncbi:MAG TPA: phosphotransferase family protein, partial [Acidimicrobiales bacterium]|nr:phosphotransferase family protein [Acidimicrobiales bacterium]
MGMVTGVNEVNVTSWMVQNVGAVAPLDFELIAGGRSNLTFRVTDAAGSAFALRRPPTSHVLPTAHDMVREHTIISALFPQGIPVARPLGLCTDPEVNERPFYVMEFVDGAILRDRAQAEAAFPVETRASIGDHLAATLAQLHEVDVDGAGLGDLARHDGYIERQLRRWRGQYEQMRVEGVDHATVVEEVGDELARTIPVQQRVAVVHGDYRLDNTVLDHEGKVRAILDWEICTLGDPMADLGVLLCYWSEAGDVTAALLGAAPTTAPGFATRDQVLNAYARHTSLDVSQVHYYQAFGYWKLACILQGVFARYRAGATAGDQGSVDEFPAHIAMLAET